MPPTVIDDPYEWESEKDVANQRKHGISFAEAATTLAHPHTQMFDDGGGTGRVKAVGMSHRRRVLTVIFEERGERDRIFSAWKSTPEERRLLLTGGV